MIMGIRGIVFHSAALGTGERTARDERVRELLEELPDVTNVIIIGPSADETTAAQAELIDEDEFGDANEPEAFLALESRLDADGANYLYIDPDKERLKAAKKAGFLTHRLVSVELLDARLKHERVFDA